MKTLILILISFIVIQTHAQSKSERPWLLSKGAAAREAKRFTLQEWLENKDRRALMDMWLTINTPSPYEFILAGSLQNYDSNITGGSTSTSTHSTYVGEITAYAQFAGLTLEHVNNYSEGFNDTTGIFNLRLFGDAVQSTHLTFHYGLRTRIATNGSYRLNQPFPAVTFQLYLMKYLGVQGHYRSYAPIKESFYGDTKSDEINYGIFVEYGSLRIFGDVYQERQNSNLSGVETSTVRSGARTGIKLFF